MAVDDGRAPQAIDAIRETVMACIRLMFPLFLGEIEESMTASDIPDWDSVAQVQLMFLIEERSGRAIDIGATFDLKTVGALVRYVEGCPRQSGA